MVKTVWKTRGEIESSLKDRGPVGIVSCGFCANLCGTGGLPGIRKMEGLIRDMGMDVAFSTCVSPCCSEAVMRETFRGILGKNKGQCGSVVLLACSGGHKAAVLAEPGVPVIGVLDTQGSHAMSERDDAVAKSVCKACGECIITYTAGLCPVSGCAAKRKKGPCDKAPESPGPCAIDPERGCVWAEIEARVGPETVAMLAARKAPRGPRAFELEEPPGISGRMRKIAYQALVRTGRLSKWVHLVR